MKAWSILSGADTVEIFETEKARDEAIVAIIKSYKDNPEDFTPEQLEAIREEDPDALELMEVTIDNWQSVLDRINEEMDEAGEAHYQCVVKEIDLENEPSGPRI